MAGVMGMPYIDMMQAGVIAEGEQVASGSTVGLAVSAVKGVETTGRGLWGFEKLFGMLVMFASPGHVHRGAYEMVGWTKSRWPESSVGIE